MLFSDLAEIRIGRGRADRLNGYATLVLERGELPAVQVAPLGAGLLLVAAAAVGQVVSTLLVYGALGLTRLVDGHAFAPVVDLLDFGVSAMIAAWIGAVAGLAWARHDHRLVVAGCFACLGVGLAFRPTLTFLDAEHVVAFAIGVAVVRPGYRRISAPVRRLVAVAVAALHSCDGRGFERRGTYKHFIAASRRPRAHSLSFGDGANH